ncbi:MAG: CBS domain-containing protein [Planctomycetota bacterium]
MTRAVATIRERATAAQAAAQMEARDVGFLAVVRGDRVRGVITDRDLVVRGVAQGRDLRSTTVAALMSPVLVTCRPEESVEEAARLMAARGVRRLLVRGDAGGRLGVLSLGDLATRTGRPELAGEVLASASARERGRPARERSRSRTHFS